MFFLNYEFYIFCFLIKTKVFIVLLFYNFFWKKNGIFSYNFILELKNLFYFIYLITDFAWSLSNDLIVSVGHDSCLKLWQVKNGKVLRVIQR